MSTTPKDNKKQTCYFTCRDYVIGESVTKRLSEKFMDLYEYSIYETQYSDDQLTFFFDVKFNKRHRVYEFDSFFNKVKQHHNITKEEPSKKELDSWHKRKMIKTVSLQDKALSKSQKEKELLEENTKYLERIQELENLLQEKTALENKTIPQQIEESTKDIESTCNLGKRPLQITQGFKEAESDEFDLTPKKFHSSSKYTVVILKQASDARTLITMDNYVELLCERFKQKWNIIFQVTATFEKLSIIEKDYIHHGGGADIEQLITDIDEFMDCLPRKVIPEIRKDQELAFSIDCKKNSLYIKRFDLSMEKWSWMLTDECLIQLAKTISKLSQLQHLHLKFSRNRNFTDKSLIQLANDVSKLSKLQHLHLDISQSGNFTDKSLIQLANGISKLWQLLHLYLGFEESKKFTDESLIQLAKTISELSQLQHLHLNFFENENFTDKSLIQLAKATIKLSQLQYLHLDIRRNKNFTDESLIQWVKDRSRLSRNDSFHFCFF